jgi:lipoprotein NlpI
MEEDASQWSPALKDFQMAIRHDPSFVYAWYRIYLVELQLGTNRSVAQNELVQRMDGVTGFKTNDWSYKVGKYLDGSLPEETFFEVASNTAPNVPVQKEQLCEANFYAGMVHLTTGDKKTASRLFENSLATGEMDFMEYTSAEAELNALNK